MAVCVLGGVCRGMSVAARPHFFTARGVIYKARLTPFGPPAAWWPRPLDSGQLTSLAYLYFARAPNPENIFRANHPVFRSSDTNFHNCVSFSSDRQQRHQRLHPFENRKKHECKTVLIYSIRCKWERELRKFTIPRS